MVVVGSRKEAVRWKLAIDKYIADKGYTIGTLAAFSGEVNDRESGPDPFTEKSSNLNQGLNGRDIREAFQGDDRQILLVANKFQTGFDQPKLARIFNLEVWKVHFEPSTAHIYRYCEIFRQNPKNYARHVFM